MIVDYRDFKTEYAQDLAPLWREVCGDKRDAEWFSARHALCAFTDGELIGCAMTEPCGRHALGLLGVRPNSRGCGVGRRLLALLCLRAKASGAVSLLVGGISADDRMGVSLLSGEGFRRVGRIDEGEDRRGALLFQKLL